MLRSCPAGEVQVKNPFLDTKPAVSPEAEPVRVIETIP
jgi:hypothetical protein